MDILTVILWATIGSVVSLIGGIMLVGSKRLRASASLYALPFGAGALLAVAFLSLLPEAIEMGDVHNVLIATLVGFIVFFLLERFATGWFHHHHGHDHEVKGKTKNSLVIVGDTLHNTIDGAAIGAAFLIDPAVGIATSIAVAAHEIPQEIGDMGILLGNGMRPKTAIIINILSALMTIIAAVGVYIFGSQDSASTPLLLAVAAGFFIYIAASDIIPDIHEKPRKIANTQTVMLLIGVMVLAGVSALLPHSHESGSHDDSHMYEEHSGHEAHHDEEHHD